MKILLLLSIVALPLSAQWSDLAPMSDINLYEQMLWEQAQQTPMPRQTERPQQQPHYYQPHSMKKDSQPWTLPSEWLHSSEQQVIENSVNDGAWVWHNKPQKPATTTPIPQWHQQ